MKQAPTERRDLPLLAAIAGPTLGGWIITNWSWRWIFDINGPIGAVAIAGAFAFVPEIRTGVRSRLGQIGIGLAGFGLLAVVFGLLEGQRYSWGTASGLVSTCAEVPSMRSEVGAKAGPAGLNVTGPRQFPN